MDMGELQREKGGFCPPLGPDPATSLCLHPALKQDLSEVALSFQQLSLLASPPAPRPQSRAVNSPLLCLHVSWTKYTHSIVKHHSLFWASYSFGVVKKCYSEGSKVFHSHVNAIVMALSKNLDLRNKLKLPIGEVSN